MASLANKFSIDKLLTKQFWNKPSIQISIIFSFMVIGVFTSLSYNNFLYLHAQNIDKLSVFNEIIKPLSGIVLLLSLIVGIISSSQLFPYFFSRGQQSILQQMNMTTSQLFILTIKLNMKFILLPFSYFMVISLLVVLNSNVDLMLLLSMSVFLLSGILFYSLVIFNISIKSKSVVFSVLISLITIVFVTSLDQIFMRYSQLSFMTIFNKLFLSSREGVVSLTEIIHLVVWMLFFTFLLFSAINQFKEPKKQIFPIVFLMGCLVTISTLKLVSLMEPEYSFMTSSVANNQLPDYYQEQIKSIPKKIEVVAVIDNEESKDEIRTAINQLKQYNSHFSLKFTSRQAFLGNDYQKKGQVNEFVSIKIGDKLQTIKYPFSNSAALSLAKLIDHIDSKSQQWITFIQGHDELSIFSTSGISLSKFYFHLKALGFPIVEQNLRKDLFISNNTKLVVLANSKQKWLKNEVDVIMEYLKRGGHLLIMREAEDNIPPRLENYLGVGIQKGILIDQQGFSSGTPHPAILIVNQFSSHPINQNITSLVAFPWSVGLIMIEPEINTESSTQKGWEEKIILSSDEMVWNESELPEESGSEATFVFEPNKNEVRKRHPLLITLERKWLPQLVKHSSETQRIIITGDASFISDNAINNYANLQLGVNMINWLLANQSENLETEIKYRDNYIQPSPFIHFMLNWFFALVFPLSLLVFFIYKQIKESKQ